MNILVTGGAGYVGSHIVRKLVENKHKVTVYDNLSQGHEDAVDKKAVLVMAEMADKSKLNLVLKKHKINAVMHMAAYVSVEESVNNPRKYFANNVDNGIILLEAMKKNNIHNLVFSSSSVVYGTKTKMPIKEDASTVPENPYGETKLIFENILEKEEASGIKSISLRYFNAAGADASGNIGEDHRPETHLIPTILREVLNNNLCINVFGNDYNTRDGTAVRDYVHVSDLADAHVLALEKLSDGHKTDVFNLGNEKGYSVLEIIKSVEKVTGKKFQIKIKGRRHGDIPIAIADSGKARKEMKWKPELDEINTIISTAWKWHKNFPNGYKK